jgi:hypothetical protein
MSKELDVRNFSTSRVTPERTTVLHALASTVSDRLPGTHKITIEGFDAGTGNASHIVSQAAPAEPGNYIKRALDHVQVIGPAFGLASVQAAEFTADPNVQETSSGAKAVNLRQRYKGIAIFQAATTVRFSPNGTLTDAVGHTITVAADVAPSPKISPTDALLQAAAFVNSPDDEDRKDQFGQDMPRIAVDLKGYNPKVRAAFKNQAEQPTVIEPGPFGAEIRASLVWFPLNESLVLGWNILVTMPDYVAQYDTIVDANSGDMLYCHQLVNHVAGQGNVYQVDGSTGRVMTPFPRPINDYGLRTPAVTQHDWRWCHKCQSLYFAGGAAQGVCPAGGAHDHTGSGDYLIVQNAPLYPGQSSWRWCHKCQGLYFSGGGTQGVCPASGAHDHTGSGNYVLQNQSPLAPGQHGWRWCHKCQSLYFANGATQGVCASGGSHDSTSSGDYSLMFAASGLPGAFPDTWITSNQAVGNSTNAHLSAAGATITGSNAGSLITFNPADPTGDDQKVLNIFYYCCYMHDFSYLLGFRELDGNFQSDNFGRGGAAGDAVDARSWPGAVGGTANMSSPVDGTSPVMNMGLVVGTNRHTAFDSTVVFHEFTHGISGRLIGGPLDTNSLAAPQSHGMNEGWSDYMACTINNVTVVGNWVVNNAAGVRGFPYDSSFPDGFGSLGTGRYAANLSGQPNDEHNVGEIWCATLMEMNRRTDWRLAVQLVIDAQKLTAANPSFLDARNSIVLALDNMVTAGKLSQDQHNGAWQGVWSAFAKFGMGPAATSNGTQLTGNHADSTVGQNNWRWCNKCAGLYYAGGANQGVCPASGAHDHTGSGNYNLPLNWAQAPGQSNWRWCHKCQGLYFAGNTTQGVCKAGGTHDHTGSGDYKMIFNAWGSPAQNNWRWCHKCQGMYYAGGVVQGSCPASGTHDHTGSGDYSIIQL